MVPMRWTPILVVGAFLAGGGAVWLLWRARCQGQDAPSLPTTRADLSPKSPLEDPSSPAPEPWPETTPPDVEGDVDPEPRLPLPPSDRADPAEMARWRAQMAAYRRALEERRWPRSSSRPKTDPREDARRDVAMGTWMIMVAGPSPKETTDSETGLPLMWVGGYGLTVVEPGYADAYSAEVRRLWRAQRLEKTAPK